jgi:type IV pilus assembly protein PilW
MKIVNRTQFGIARLSLARSAGFSLIELMVAITIGLVILASLVGVLSATSSSSSSNDRESDLVTNGRYAVDTMKQEIRKAGFKGYTAFIPLNAPGPWTAPTTGCFEAGSSVDAFISNLHQGIWGRDQSNAIQNPFKDSCVPGDGSTATSSYAANTDVLVIRRVSDFPLGNTAALSANTIYFQSTYTQGQMFRSTSVPVRPTFAGVQQPLDTFAVQTYVYYISPFTVSSGEVPKIPALWRVALQPDGSMARELVVSGIEQMQIQYGVQPKDSKGRILSTQYVDSLSGSTTEAATDPKTGWDTVQFVQLWLLARSATAEPGYVNKQTYSMGNYSYTPNDSFRRQLFSTIVELRN